PDRFGEAWIIGRADCGVVTGASDDAARVVVTEGVVAPAAPGVGFGARVRAKASSRTLAAANTRRGQVNRLGSLRRSRGSTRALTSADGSTLIISRTARAIARSTS